MPAIPGSSHPNSARAVVGGGGGASATNSSVASSSSPTTSAAPRPIQFTPFQASDFRDNVDFVNQTLSQFTTTINSLLGQGGPVQFPSGLDMQGAKVTGLAAPSSPSDAISAGHASTQFSAAAQQPQLDIGGDYTLKGLAYAYQQAGAVPGLQGSVASILAQLAAGATGTVTLAKITGGGANGSLTFAQGLITGFVAPT